MNKGYAYALYINNPSCDNDRADWFDDLPSALQAGRTAVEQDPDADVKIMKFDTQSGDCEWNSEIEIDADGGAWSDDWDARNEMGYIQ